MPRREKKKLTKLDILLTYFKFELQFQNRRQILVFFILFWGACIIKEISKLIQLLTSIYTIYKLVNLHSNHLATHRLKILQQSKI